MTRTRFDSRFLKAALMRLIIEPHLCVKYKKHLSSDVFNISGNNSALTAIAEILFKWTNKEVKEITIDAIWSKLNLMPNGEVRDASLMLLDDMRIDNEIIRLAKSDHVFNDFLQYIKCKVFSETQVLLKAEFEKGNYNGAFEKLEDALIDIKGLTTSSIQEADWDNSLEFLEEEGNRPDKRFALGIDHFDGACGFEPQTLNLFVAMTGGGKTMLTVHLVRQAILQGKYLYVVCVEDRKVSFLRRVYSSMTGIPLNHMKNFHNLSPADRTKVMKARDLLKKYVTIEFIYGQPPDFIFSRIKELIAIRKTQSLPAYEAVAIDYLQHIASISSGDSQHERLSLAMARLKDFALENNLVAFTHQQVNRGGAATATKSDNGTIGLSDLSTSFQATFTCDTIMSINRTPKMKEQDEAIFCVLKGREGATDKKYLVHTAFDVARYDMDDCDEINGTLDV